MDIDRRIERERRKQEIYEMSKGVRIASGHEAEGAVAALLRCASVAYDVLEAVFDRRENEFMVDLKDALARFEVDTEPAD